MNEIAEPKKLFEPQNRVLPSDPRDWNLLDLMCDTNATHKKFEEEEWSCPDCGKKEMWNPIYFGIVPTARCEPCLEIAKKKEAEQGDEERETKHLEQKSSLIPPLYHSTDYERLPYPQRDEVGRWRPQKDGKGLWVVGDTRQGKTRTICLLLDALIKEGHSVKTFFHGNFNDELVEVIRSERSFRKWKYEITSANILFIDDLFASKLTERVESSMFDILDERISWNRPTLITTQLTAKEAKQRFHSPKRCEAFFARVKEFFQVVSFVPQQQGGFDL